MCFPLSHPLPFSVSSSPPPSPSLSFPFLFFLHQLQVSHSSEEVLALKRYIQKSNADMDKLREQIAANKGKDDFLMGHR